MKFVMLRAGFKQTKVIFNGQIAKNDGAHDDVTTLSDFWIVFANELLIRGFYDQVEVWYQTKNDPHSFEHSSGLIERYFKPGYKGSDTNIHVLFVRGNLNDYRHILGHCQNTFKIYYPSGPYHTPKFTPDLSFVEDVRHLNHIKAKKNFNVELFKKGCVEKYFLCKNENINKTWDLCFVACAPIYKRKGIERLHKLLISIPKLKVLVIGLRDTEIEKKFASYNVTFSGWIPRTSIGNFMTQCKYGIILSTDKEDGCPRVIQEFLACGTPVLVYDETCCSDFYLNQQTGFRFSNESMVKTVKHAFLLEHNILRPRKYFLNNLTMDHVIEHFVSILQRHGGPVCQLNTNG